MLKKGRANSTAGLAKPHSCIELFQDPHVASWIRRYQEGESQESYARALERILDAAILTTDELLALSPDDAKRIIFSIADDEKKRGRHAQARKTVIDLVQRVDAVGREASMRPNMEKGFSTSEGGPHIRIDGASCF
ncbi:hypothetical protein [[Eubacterium] cellulosolvens]